MKNLHLYAVSMLISYWAFSSLSNVNIWTFIAPILITYWYLKAESEAEKRDNDSN